MVPGLQESQEPVDEEEEDSRKNHAEVGSSYVEYVEDNVDSVEVVGVEEHLKHLSPYFLNARYPHRYCCYGCDLSRYV